MIKMENKQEQEAINKFGYEIGTAYIKIHNAVFNLNLYWQAFLTLDDHFNKNDSAFIQLNMFMKNYFHMNSIRMCLEISKLCDPSHSYIKKNKIPNASLAFLTEQLANQIYHSKLVLLNNEILLIVKESGVLEIRNKFIAHSDLYFSGSLKVKREDLEKVISLLKLFIETLYIEAFDEAFLFPDYDWFQHGDLLWYIENGIKYIELKNKLNDFDGNIESKEVNTALIIIRNQFNMIEESHKVLFPELNKY